MGYRTIQSNLQDIMKQFFAIALCFLAVGVFSQDTTVCTEADHATSYATCAAIEAYCATTVNACNGNNACLDAVTSVFDTYLAGQTAVLNAISDCSCAEFTCDRNYGVADDNSSAMSLGASVIMAAVAMLLL